MKNDDNEAVVSYELSYVTEMRKGYKLIHKLLGLNTLVDHDCFANPLTRILTVFTSTAISAELNELDCSVC